jgi:glyoxylase-like metal-dependent hydrolase (beta-lactamase superfamily II)
MSSVNEWARPLGQGISQITLPLPFAAPRTVNAYLIESSDGLALIDCGVDTAESRNVLFGGLTHLGYHPASIDTLIISHLHPDHVGMAPRLVEGFGMRVVMHERAAKVVDRYNDTPGFGERIRTLARRHGVPSHAYDAFVDVGPRPDWMPFLALPDITVDEGDSIAIGSNRPLQVIFTPGHEPTHICLRDSRTGVLFAGDHILPRITPFVGYDEDFPDVLGEFLNSLRKIEALRITTTYPAHGDLVSHGSARAEQILLHHQRRLAGMSEVVAPLGSSAWQVMEQVFRPNLSPMDQRLALRETIAHLEHLQLTGRVQHGDDPEIVRYRR